MLLLFERVHVPHLQLPELRVQNHHIRAFFPEHGTRENNNTYICWAYPCIMHISILDTRCDQKNRVGPGSFPTKHPDAGGNYRTGRCTDGRKVKVLA